MSFATENNQIAVVWHHQYREFCRPSPERSGPDTYVRVLTAYARNSTGIACVGPSTAYPDLLNRREPRAFLSGYYRK